MSTCEDRFFILCDGKPCFGMVYYHINEDDQIITLHTIAEV